MENRRPAFRRYHRPMNRIGTGSIPNKMQQTVYIVVFCGFLLFSVPLFSIGVQAEDSIQKAQAALKERGIDPGPIDGILGDRTRSAIKQYQMKKGLAETGILDEETKQSLGISAVSREAEEEETTPLHRYPMTEDLETRTDQISAPSAEKSKSDPPAKVDAVSTAEPESVVEHPADGPPDAISDTASTTQDQRLGGRLRLSTLAMLMVLSVMGFAALHPVSWVLLTGGGLITVLLLMNWLGGYFNTTAYAVFACAYSIPVLCRMVLNAWDMVLVFALFLGAPAVLLSKYAFGLEWWMAICNGVAAMALVPTAYRRMFSKRRYRGPYRTLYDR